MRVLFDIVHPADVLFFKRPLEMLRDEGHDCLVLSRRKDIACDLLDAFGIPHVPVSTAGRGALGLARELIARDIAVFRQARAFKPDVMIGFGGVAISHVGWLTGVPSISFYDSDNATLQNRLTRPFITRMYVPEAYAGPTPAGRTVRLKGTKDLSYLHPNAFMPDRDEALAAGLDPERDNFFLRLVAWNANHDMGKAGWTADMLDAVVAHLSARGRVHISSETPLPERYADLAYRGPKDAVHHLLAACRLMVGESATMACESGLLGTPAIYAGRDFPAYTLDMERAGLIRNLSAADAAALTRTIDEWLAQPAADTRAARDAYVQSCPDWAEEVVAALQSAVARQTPAVPAPEAGR